MRIKTLAVLIIAAALCSHAQITSSSVNTTGSIVIGGGAGGGGGAVSITLSSSSPPTVSGSVTTQEIGSLSSPITIHVTNGTGSTVAMFANFNVQGWSAGNFNFIQYSGDGVAPTWNNGCLSLYGTTFNLTNGSTCDITASLQPTVAGASSGSIIFRSSATNALLGTVNLTGTGTTPATQSIPTLPTGIASDYTGTVFDTRWVDVSGYTTKTVCASGCDFTTLTAALTFASTNCGSTGVLINVSANTKLTENPILPVNNCAGSWTTVTLGSSANVPSWNGKRVVIKTTDINATTGNGSTLPAKGTRVQNGSCDSLGQCRPSATQIAAMFTLQSSSGTAALRAANGAAHYRFAGAEFTSTFTPDGTQQAIVYTSLDDGAHPAQNSDLAQDIVFDRVYAHTKYGNGTVMSTSVTMAVDGNYIGVVDSYCDSDGSANEVQCIFAATNNTGPIKIVNTWMQHSGEALFFGGGDGLIYGTSTHDIEVRNAKIYKPLQWNPVCLPIYGGGSNPCPVTYDGGLSGVTPNTYDNAGWTSAKTYALGDVTYDTGTVSSTGYYISLQNSNTNHKPNVSPTFWKETTRAIKNLFESKKSLKMLVIGTTMDNNWAGFQEGTCFLQESADQAGSDIYAVNTDTTFVYNILRGCNNTFNFAPASYAYPSQTQKRALFKNNLSYNIGAGYLDPSNCAVTSNCGQTMVNIGPGSSNAGGTAHGFYGGWDVTFEKNTFLDGQKAVATASDTAPNYGQYRFTVKDNIFEFGTYGWMNNGVTGDGQFFNWFSGYTFANNVMVGPNGPAVNTAYTTGLFLKPFSSSHSVAGIAANYSLCTGVGAPDGSCTGASPWLTACTGGTACGADIATLTTVTACTQSGTSCNPNP